MQPPALGAGGAALLTARRPVEEPCDLVDALAATTSLRVPADQAVETVWALTSPELHQLLVRHRGWTRRYVNWLSDSLAVLLL